MPIFKGVIFPNINAFNGKQGAVFNYYKAKQKQDFDYTVPDYVTKWADPIFALDGTNQVLMVVDERVNGFPWNPEQVIDVSTTDPKWFNQELL